MTQADWEARVAARDTAGFESEAEHLYCRALGCEDLDAYRRTRATIQLGSTLRLLGRLDELAPHLSRYQRSMSRNAAALVAKTWSP
jgi:hypothetical protein